MDFGSFWNIVNLTYDRKVVCKNLSNWVEPIIGYFLVNSLTKEEIQKINH